MKILIVNPENSVNFYKYLSLIFKKSFSTPLGILTAAAVLPDDWDKKFVDLNVNPLKDSDIIWADYIFMGGLLYQQDSMADIVRRAKKFNKRIIAGGSLMSRSYRFPKAYKSIPEEFRHIDHYVLDEAEITLKEFIHDLSCGKTKRVYESTKKIDMKSSPVPLWGVINLKDYFRVSIQYSKGCPNGCEFCDIFVMDGFSHRVKSGQQIIDELDVLYNKGWRGTVAFIDDNFTFNKKMLKTDLFPKLKDWLEDKKYPFTFDCMSTIDLSNDPDILREMKDIGFTSIFFGIETASKTSLLEVTKNKNWNVNLEENIFEVQRHGIYAHGGFILGFDTDDVSSADEMIEFIQKTAIIFIRVSVLAAPPGTKLYNRLKKEGRLISAANPNFLKGETNFDPKIGEENLIKGYNKIVKELNSPKNFKSRVLKFMDNVNDKAKNKNIKASINTLLILLNVTLRLGVFHKRSRIYRKVFMELIKMHPDKLETIIGTMIYWHSNLEFYEEEAEMTFNFTSSKD